jgi:hypothetical protein
VWIPGALRSSVGAAAHDKPPARKAAVTLALRAEGRLHPHAGVILDGTGRRLGLTRARPPNPRVLGRPGAGCKRERQARCQPKEN